VRLERTETNGEGAVIRITPAERARRAAWVGAVTSDELRRRTIAEYSARRTASGAYPETFPGLHLKYEVMRGLITRASYATNIGRPAIGPLIPRTTVNYDNRSLSPSNPSLRPQYADNYDVGLEYYFKPVGLLSAGAFHKEIKNFIYTLDLKTVYTINRRFDVYLDVINVFARADRAWEYWGGRPNGTEWMRPEFLFGLNARL